MENDNVIPFKPREPKETMSEFQREMLWAELESVERRREDIRRLLGIIGTEKGLEG